MVDPSVIKDLVSQFPEMLRDPQQIRSNVFKQALKLLQSKVSGIVPGLPTSLSGLKSQGIKFAKAQIRKQLGGRLGFIDQFLGS